MKLLFLLPLAVLLFTRSCAQRNTTTPGKVGGPCEGCEAIFESPMALHKLSWIDTLPDFHDPGPKLMVRGIIYQADGKTPAPDVVLYIYHTDQTGRYPTKKTSAGWGKRHGYIRGWVRTNAAGAYAFYTLKPGAYPGGGNPAHIHATIKEPDKNEYYIEDFLFDNDPYLTKKERDRREDRGGNGILVLKEKNGIAEATRDIILGRNIPGYPVQ